MPGSRRTRRTTLLRSRCAILQLLLAVFLATSLSGLAHAAQEVVENAVHVSTEGHGAHADEHPEGECDPGGEHDCFGLVHRCGCCSTVAATDMPTATVVGGVVARSNRTFADESAEALGVRARIDRPPRR